MVNYCVVRNCKTGLKNCKLKRSAFKVPNDVELKKKWEAAIPGISILRNRSRVCERHFNEDDIIRTYKHVAENGMILAEGNYFRPRLRNSAIPSLFEDDKPHYNKFCIPYAKNSVPEINVSQNIKQELTDEETSGNQMDIWIDSDLLSDGNSEQDPLNLQAIEVKSEPEIISSKYVEESFKGEIPKNRPETMYEETPENVQNLVYENASEKVLESVDQEKSTIDFNHLTFFNSNNLINNSIPLPKKWGVTKVPVEKGEYFLFTYSFLINTSDVEYPVSCLHVKLDVNKNLKYFIFGHLVDFESVNLPPSLNCFNDISQILILFQRKGRCCGFGDNNFLNFNEIFIDCFSQWHSNQCDLITTRKRCNACFKLKNIQDRKKRRNEKWKK